MHSIEHTGLLYIAAPYGHQSPGVRADRASHVTHALGIATTYGALAYSPISHLLDMRPHPRLLDADPQPPDLDPEKPKVDYYYEHGLAMLRRCDALVVLKLEGWYESLGVDYEMALARRLGMSITYIEEEELERTSDMRVERTLGWKLRLLSQDTRDAHLTFPR